MRHAASVTQKGRASGIRYASNPFAVLLLILEAMNSDTNNVSKTMKAILRFIKVALRLSSKKPGGNLPAELMILLHLRFQKICSDEGDKILRSIKICSKSRNVIALSEGGRRFG